jgi:pimeloyl-ACP methyl ester carboxylesterase
MDNLVMNYRVVGNGPPLLLIHGFGISFNIWKNLLPLLCSYFTLVMVELPGIGKSPMPYPGRNYLYSSVDALDQVRSNLGFDIWNVLGYSTGTRIAETYVKAFPAHVSKVIFLCPLKVENIKILLLRCCFGIDRLVPVTIPWLLSGWRLKFLILVLGFSLQSDPLIEDWQSEISRRPVQALKEIAGMIIPIGTKPFYVPRPYSMIWGDKDLVPFRPRKPELSDYFIHANHAAPVLAANEVSEIVLNFLKCV